jgi:hypothetical protein
MQPVSGQQLSKHAPVDRQLQQLDCNNGNGVFYVWSVPICYEQKCLKQRVQLRVEFYTGGCKDTTWACEDEEYPMLEAFARQGLVKKQQAGIGLACAVVICEL